jgi:hypothetical protein
MWVNPSNESEVSSVLDLIGKIVTLETFETTYTGKLIEIGVEEVHLETDMGWVVIPVDRVAEIKEKAE